MSVIVGLVILVAIFFAFFTLALCVAGKDGRP